MSDQTAAAPKTEPLFLGIFPQEMVKSGLRSILITGGAGLVTHGWVDQATETQIATSLAGLLVILASAAWGVINKRKANKIAMVEAIPEVQRVVVTKQDTADAAGPKVVTPADISAGVAPPLQGTIPPLPLNDSRL